MLQEVHGMPADGVCEESKVVSALQIDSMLGVGIYIAKVVYI